MAFNNQRNIFQLTKYYERIVCQFYGIALLNVLQFGLCVADVNYPDSQNTVECIAVMDESDKLFNSWTYWNRDIWGDDGIVKPERAIVFARPYPMAISGKPEKVNMFNCYLIILGVIKFLYLREFYETSMHLYFS